MPPVRNDVARRPELSAHTPYRSAPATRPNPYAAWLCPALAKDWSEHIACAMAAGPRERADTFLGVALARSASGPNVQDVRAEIAMLQTLLSDAPQKRLIVAKSCFNLIGANLPGPDRLRGLECLRAAAAFGTARLAAIVKTCAPLACAPERRLAVLEGLWHDVGADDLPKLMALCAPMLEQRRGMPERTTRAVERVLRRAHDAQRHGRDEDRAGVANNEYNLSLVTDTCGLFLRDDNENVMLSSRIEATRDAIDIVRAHVPDPMHHAPVLACVQLFVQGMAQHADAHDHLVCLLALQTLTGKWRDAVERWPELGVVRNASASARHTRFDAPFAPSGGNTKDERNLWRNIRLDTPGASPIGMGELCALLWQVITRYTDPEKTPQDNERSRANMRYALVCALARCSEEGGIVCPVGISQNLLNAVQGYLPFVIDHVEHEAHPQSVVTYLMQSFHHQNLRADAEGYAASDWDDYDEDTAQKQRSKAFF